jgi:hypothetical protein
VIRGRRFDRTALWVAGGLAVVLLAGGALRLSGQNWDDGDHLHPDERYLSIVDNDIRGPGSLAGYFDVEHSRLSPYNNPSGKGYVYGELPLYATKAAATLLDRDSFGQLNLVGRHISAVVDLLSILLVFLIGRELFAPLGRDPALGGALLASALYALAVTAIQHAHFFTVESWLVFWTLLTFWLAVLAATGPSAGDRRRYALNIAIGLALGATVSSKLSGGLVLLPVAVALGARAIAAPVGSVANRLIRLTADGLVVIAAAYVAFRLTSPYSFAHSSWLDVSLNADFRTALEQQQDAINGKFLYPPAYQWLLSTSIVDPGRNLLVYGLGPALGIAAVAGVVVLGVLAVRRGLADRRLDAIARDRSVVVPAMLLLFSLVTFTYVGTRFVNSLRYLVPMAPLLCVAAAAAVLWLRRFGRVLPAVAAAAVLLPTLAWALAFTHVYREPNTRVAATGWLNAQVKPGSVIVSEHWDDALPVGAPPGRWVQRELPVFDPDDATKLGKLYAGLHDADVYVLSSPRAWNSIGRLPGRFPLMVRFYDRLRHGGLPFRRVAEFTSHPQLLGVSVDDLGAEETFWVYDHPPVEIYRRTGSFTEAQLRAAVCGGERLPGC